MYIEEYAYCLFFQILVIYNNLNSIINITINTIDVKRKPDTILSINVIY